MSDSIAFHTSSLRRVAAILRGAGAKAEDLFAIQLGECEPSWHVPPLLDYASRRAVMGPNLLSGSVGKPSMANMKWLLDVCAKSARPAAVFHHLIETRPASELQGWRAMRMWAPLRSAADNNNGITDALAIGVGLAVAAGQIYSAHVETGNGSYLAIDVNNPATVFGVAKGSVVGAATEDHSLTQETLDAYIAAPRAMLSVPVWPAVRQIRRLLETTPGVAAEHRVELDSVLGAFGAMYRRSFGCPEGLNATEEAINGHILARFLGFLATSQDLSPSPGARKAAARAKVTAVTEAIDFVKVAMGIPERNLITGLYSILVPAVTTRKEILNAAYDGAVTSTASIGRAPVDPAINQKLLVFLSDLFTQVDTIRRELEYAA